MKPNVAVLLFAVLLAALCCHPASAQVSSQLKIDSVERLPDNQVRITFSDAGTGATGYEVESTPEVGPGAEWMSDPQTQITPLDATSSTATLPFVGDMGFFRILALGGTGSDEVIASFSSDSITVNESEGSVSIQITFNRSFRGTLFYTVGGSATPEDVGSLSGEVEVDGLSATIEVQLLDNINLNELRYLTLDLSAGAGYSIGNVNQANLIIQDDDTFWSGNFQENGNPVSFTLKLLEGTGGLSGFLIGNGTGIFPEGEFEAQVSMTDSEFSLLINAIPLAADSSMFNTEALLSLTLGASDGVEGQSVEEAEIEGAATLSIEFPTQPQLNTSLSGPFLLIRQAIRPSSKQIELTSN